MPLLDHFHPPLSERRPWESFQTTWAGTLADALNRDLLPPGYIALEQVHAGAAVEIDVATLAERAAPAAANGGGTATATRKDDALLFDAGENGRLAPERLGDLTAVFVTHHHIDHFVGLDRIVGANLDRDKVLHVLGPEGTIRKVYNRITSCEHPFFPFQKLVLQVHDSYYSQAKQAATYRHMTATQAAEFAGLARVDRLALMHFAPRYAGRYDALVEEARAAFPNVSAELP